VGFQNPLNAGQTLILGSLHSPNYVTDVSGWSINKDGSAQFNSVTIIGNSVIVNNPNNDGQASMQAGAVGNSPSLLLRPPATGTPSHAYNAGSINATSTAGGDGSLVFISPTRTDDPSGAPPTITMKKTYNDGSTVDVNATTLRAIQDFTVFGTFTDDQNPVTWGYNLATTAANSVTKVTVDQITFTFKNNHYYRVNMCGHAKTTAGGCIPQMFLTDSPAVSGTERGFISLQTGGVTNNDQYFDTNMYIMNKSGANITRTLVWSVRTNGVAGTVTLEGGTYNPLPPLLWAFYDLGTSATNGAPWACAL
jgi:hypothetical protein